METLPSNIQHGQPRNMPYMGMPGEVTSSDQNAFDIWGLLNRRKWIVFIGAIFGLGLGYLYHTQATSQYQSEAAILVEPKNPIPILDNGGNYMASVDNYTSNHDKIIVSESFIDKTFLNNDTLLSGPSFQGNSRGDNLRMVAENVVASQDKDEANLFYLSFKCGDEDDSKRVLQALIATYRDELAEKYRDRSGELVDLFRKVQTKFREDYTQAAAQHKALKSTMDTINVYNTGNGKAYLTLNQVKVRDLDERLTAVTEELAAAREQKEFMDNAMANGDDTSEALVWNLENGGRIRPQQKESHFRDREVETTRAKITELTLARSSLTEKYGAKHPDLQALDRQITLWTDYLNTGILNGVEAQNANAIVPAEEVLRRYRVGLEQQVASLDVRYLALKTEFQFHYEKSRTLEGIQSELMIKEAEIEQIQKWLDNAEERSAQLNMSEFDQDKGYNFEILRRAETGNQVWPNLFVLLGAGFVLGSSLGFGLAYLVDIADKTFRSPDEITRQLGLPLIGHIPVMATSKKYKTDDSLIDPVICSYHRPKSQTAEAFRAIRTALYFNTQGKHNSVIQVTSPTPGDGKSTVSCNLAVSIAQSGKRVLLVDGDMRRPTTHHMFGIKTNEGFATALAGKSRWQDGVFTCEEIEGLSIMPCGAKPANPAELTTSPRVKQLIEEMRTEYDFVIIDTPPVLAVTDPCPIAARVDGVILTLRIKKNVKISAERAVEVLGSIGANIVGVVVNGVGVQSGYGSQYSYGAYRSGYSYSGYGYGYGYGYGAGKYYEEEKAGPATRGGAPAPKRLDAPSGSNEQTPV